MIRALLATGQLAFGLFCFARSLAPDSAPASFHATGAALAALCFATAATLFGDITGRRRERAHGFRLFRSLAEFGRIDRGMR